MKLINCANGTTTKNIFYFETLPYGYDNSNEPIEFMDTIVVFGRRYIIDDNIHNEDVETITAHKYDRVRKLKHELTFVIDWNYLTYHYEMKKYDIA